MKVERKKKSGLQTRTWGRVWYFLWLMAEQLWFNINKWRRNNQLYLTKYPLTQKQHATNFAFIKRGNPISHSSVFSAPWHVFMPAPSGLAQSRNTAHAHFLLHRLATPTSPIFYHNPTKVFYKKKKSIHGINYKHLHTDKLHLKAETDSRAGMNCNEDGAVDKRVLTMENKTWAWMRWTSKRRLLRNLCSITVSWK